jgi:phenylalanyl-tRNA synthetase alpha chain
MPIQNLIKTASNLIKEAPNLPALEAIRTQILGKQGELTQLLKKIGERPQSERPQMGQIVNQAKQQLQNILEKRYQVLKEKALIQTLHSHTLDVSLPGRGETLGSCHPLTQTTTQLEQLFVQAGFRLMTGPEIEDEEHNFTALNIPSHHPARALHDTFYLQNGLLLRTHTSTVQIRALKQQALPLRMISTGRVYRCDSDITHTPMFHQLEGLVITETANLAELKGLLTAFLQTFFENPQLKLRFRASYFPFTEPSAEVDVQCTLCTGLGCHICHHTGWLEILGCGMTHPKVLKYAGVDPEQYQGYAFGMGIDRLTLLRHGIPDLRLLFENDIHFLKQF